MSWILGMISGILTYSILRHYNVSGVLSFVGLLVAVCVVRGIYDAIRR